MLILRNRLKNHSKFFLLENKNFEGGDPLNQKINFNIKDI
jgi:hypothetical protein